MSVRMQLAALAAVLALVGGGCSSAAPASAPPVDSSLAVSPSPEASATAASGPYIPAEPVTVRIWDWNAGKDFYPKAFEEFNRTHKNITVDYQFIASDQFPTAVKASFEARNPPDLFLGFFEPLAEEIGQGWVQPIADPSDPDLMAWKAKFPEGTFVDGAQVIDGQIYSFPILFEPNTIYLYYNKTLFAKAGITQPPATWSELRETARRITAAGAGKFYGMVTGSKDVWPWFMNISYLAATAGGSSSGVAGAPPMPFDYRTATFKPNDQSVKDAMQLWLDMKADGSVIPGVDGLGDADAHLAFGSGKAAMMFSGIWTPSVLAGVTPDADFGVAAVPVPDGGRKGWDMHNAAWSFVESAQTKDRRAVFEVIKFLTSVEHQTEYVKAGVGLAFWPEANSPANITAKGLAEIAQIGPASQKQAPVLPAVTGKVAPKWSEPQFTSVLDGIWLGKLQMDALDDLAKRMNAEFDAAIEAARAQGVDVTKETFIVPGWDPANP